MAAVEPTAWSADAQNMNASIAPRDFLIRSEERLSVTTERVPSGWVRLEKYLVTEMQTITVELTHEEVRVVRGPATGDTDFAARQVDAFGGQKNQARWMPLSREEAVVTTRVVPVERVRLEVYAVTEERWITEQVRKEQIDTAHFTVEDDPQEPS